MSLPKPVAAAAAVTAAFAIGAAAATTSAAAVPATPTADIGIPAVLTLTCPTWYGRNNPADGACLRWCDSRNIAPCSAP